MYTEISSVGKAMECSMELWNAIWSYGMEYRIMECNMESICNYEMEL